MSIIPHNNPDVIVIPLTLGLFTVIDVIDTDLSEFNWHVSLEGSGRYYATRWTSSKNGQKRKHVYLHRIIFERILGREQIKGEVCDHIDNDPLNNSRSNMRLATTSQNVRNSKLRSNNTSGYKGVYFNTRDQKWQAQITIDGRVRFLGLFLDLQEAAKAYAEASAKYHGEFGRLE